MYIYVKVSNAKNLQSLQYTFIFNCTPDTSECMRELSKNQDLD